MRRRLLSFVLVVSLILCSVPPVFAAETPNQQSGRDIVHDYSIKGEWDAFFETQLTALSAVSDALSSAIFSRLWSELDYVVSKMVPERVASIDILARKVSTVNGIMRPGVPPGVPNIDLSIYTCDFLKFALGGITSNFSFSVVDHPEYGYVIQEDTTGLILCNSKGSLPYYLPTTTDPDTGEEVADPALGGKWVRMDKVAGVKNVVSEAVLDDLVVALVTAGETVRYSEVEGKWKGIQSKTRFENGIPFVYCDSKSRQYVQQLDPDEFAVNNNQNIFIEDDDGDGIFDDGVTKENQFIDIDSNTIWFPDGTFFQINNNLYDESTKSYYIDASSSYDIDNNYYYTYNYHYEYHIDYTSITYIGQTAEYDEVYEYYYQLPDGRSSADLTAEELQALNTQIDVLPYIRSADDTSIRALYHFDGDTRDSSYWSHLGEFKWNKGGTLTYMDVGAFNGALYLNENEHDFEITLPSNLGSADFTIQFRIYQSATPAAAGDTYVSIGDSKVLQNNGNVWYYDNNTVVGQASPGTWNEICLMRKDSVLYYFQNGVFTKSISLSTILGDTVRFVFGNRQQTYKYFDEFRVINEAIYLTTGYTPTSVPHDTNLALVLPDSQLPVADEYWSFKSSYENLLAAHGLAHAADISADSDIYFANSSYSLFEYGNRSWYNPGGDWDIEQSVQSSWVGANKLAYLNRAYLDFVVDGFFARFEHTSRVTNPDRLRYMSKYETASTAFEYPANAFVIPILYSVDQTQSSITGSLSPNYFITSGDVFTFSMVASDGTVGSFTFDCSSDRDTSYYFNGYTFRLYRGLRVDMTSDIVSLVTLSIYPTEVGAGGDFVYLELVDGDTTDLTAEFVSSVVAMDKDDLNTPSLAVRTDLDITGYQIGGVRPSLPTKGLVWALVEAGRITSLQIYNGQAWEEVDGRIWTGSRWVPYYAYDVLLLKDMWDIVEADPSLNPIYTEAGFWKWLQEAWGEMMKKLDQIAAGSGGSGSGSGETKSFWNRIADAFTAGLTALIEGVFSLITEILKTLLSLVTDMLSFLFSFISETVLGGISDFFSAFTDGSLLDGFQQTDENGNTTTQLPEGVAAVFADISGLISALPAELLSVLVIGIALLFLLGVIMLIV